jgi:hypothetical protein
MSRLKSVFKVLPKTTEVEIGNENIGIIAVPKTGLLQAEKAMMDELRSILPDVHSSLSKLIIKITDDEGISYKDAYALVTNPGFEGLEDIRQKYLADLKQIWSLFNNNEARSSVVATQAILQCRLLNKTQHSENLAVSTSAIKSVVSQIMLVLHPQIKEWMAKSNGMVPASEITKFLKGLESKILEDYEIITEEEVGELPVELINEFYKFFRKEENLEEDSTESEKQIPSEEETRKAAEEGKPSKKQIGTKSSGD